MWPLSSDGIYVSIDIEADGRIPGLNSMLSLGAAALTSEGRLADTLSVNLEQLPDATTAVPSTRWWAAHSEAWEACRTNTEAPEPAMRRFHAWLEAMLSAVGWPVMVGYPIAFDAMWVQWYLHRFAGEDPFRRRAIEIKTLAMVAMGAGYRPTARTPCLRVLRIVLPPSHGVSFPTCAAARLGDMGRLRGTSLPSHAKGWSRAR